MILSRRVELEGEQLDELDERIVITGIDEAAGKDNITAVASAGGDGQRITQKRRDSLDITVKFRLLIHKDDLQARSVLLEDINGWAVNGGWLKIGYRKRRRIMVTLAQAAAPADLWQWTNEFSIVFRAYSQPYWESTILTEVVSESISDGNMFIEVPGRIQTPLMFKAKNISGQTINSISVTVDGKKISLSELGLQADKSLTFDYLQTDRLYVPQARIGTTQVRKALTSDSVDEIMLQPGSTTRVYVKTSRAVQMTLWCRGRYL